MLIARVAEDDEGAYFTFNTPLEMQIDVDVAMPWWKEIDYFQYSIGDADGGVCGGG